MICSLLRSNMFFIPLGIKKKRLLRGGSARGRGPGMLSVCARGTAGDLPENPAEVAHILIADIPGNGCDALICAQEQLFSFLNPKAVEVIPERYSSILSEDTAEIAFTDPDSFR